MPKPRLIAFYLPQYHSIPENDEWWGKGFTDWTNVKKGKPRFFGHHQPHIPADLGYYDLTNEEIRIAQTELAKQYGITGFCYYHYWFNEKMLLEKPFNEVLESGKPDFPFCLCWANENWTRRWDGKDKDILMEQNYENYDAERHLLWLEKAFENKRYIRVNDKPVLLIYNSGSIPNISSIINTWRKKIFERGYNGIYLSSVKSVNNTITDSDAIGAGFDSVVQFKPSLADLKRSSFRNSYVFFFNILINKIISVLKLGIKTLPVTSVYNYDSMVNKIISEPKSNFKTFPCVMPGWDNSARKKFSSVIQNDNSEIYKKWLRHAFKMVKGYLPDEQIVFINAWNEWAEGCHLEPDLRNGRKFLEATLQAIQSK